MYLHTSYIPLSIVFSHKGSPCIQDSKPKRGKNFKLYQ